MPVELVELCVLVWVEGVLTPIVLLLSTSPPHDTTLVEVVVVVGIVLLLLLKEVKVEVVPNRLSLATTA